MNNKKFFLWVVMLCAALFFFRCRLNEKPSKPRQRTGNRIILNGHLLQTYSDTVETTDYSFESYTPLTEKRKYNWAIKTKK